MSKNTNVEAKNKKTTMKEVALYGGLAGVLTVMAYLAVKGHFLMGLMLAASLILMMIGLDNQAKWVVRRIEEMRKRVEDVVDDLKKENDE